MAQGLEGPSGGAGGGLAGKFGLGAAFGAGKVGALALAIWIAALAARRWLVRTPFAGPTTWKTRCGPPPSSRRSTCRPAACW